MLSEVCKVNHVLHEGQMCSKRQRSGIDVVASVVGRVQESWAEKRLTEILLIDVKDAFDYVSRNFLLPTMEGMSADGDLMQWTESFMSDRREGLVIDKHQCE